MKRKISRIAIVGAVSAVASLASASQAAVLEFWWDVNGVNAGATDTDTAGGTWDNVSTNRVWNTSSDGIGNLTANQSTAGNTFFDYTSSRSNAEVHFSAGANATGVSTITLSSTRSANSISFEEGNVLLTGSSITLAAATNGDAARTGHITVAAGATATVNSQFGTASTAFKKLGVGTLELGGNNSYTGLYDLAEGTTKLTRSSAGGVGFDNSVFSTATVQLSGGTLDMNGRKESFTTFNLLSGSVIDTDASAATFDPTAGPQNFLTASSAYNLQSGSIAARMTGSASSLTKTTAGTVTLSGRNSWSGTANINGGRLVVTGTLPAALINVNVGGTLAGAGAGSDSESYADTGRLGKVRVLSGGTIDIGADVDATGLLVIRGGTSDGFTLDSGATMEIDIGGTTAGTGYDQLRVNSGSGNATVGATPVSLAGTLSVDLIGGFAPANGDLFFILTQDVTASTATAGGTVGNIGGTFAGLADGATFSADGATFEISYFGDSDTGSFTGGNDVVLRAVVPEPTTLAALAGLGTLALRRRRRA